LEARPEGEGNRLSIGLGDGADAAGKIIICERGPRIGGKSQREKAQGKTNNSEARRKGRRVFHVRNRVQKAKGIPYEKCCNSPGKGDVKTVCQRKPRLGPKKRNRREKKRKEGRNRFFTQLHEGKRASTKEDAK